MKAKITYKTTLAILISTLILGVSESVAQSEIFTVKTGEIAVKVIPQHMIYRYEQFQPGNISFYNGKTLPAMLNYNHLFGEMQFIQPQGDTLSVANEQYIRQIQIGKSLFYYDPKNGYIESIATYASVQLGEKQVLSIQSVGAGNNGQFDGYFGPSADGISGHRLLTTRQRALAANKMFTQPSEYVLHFKPEQAFFLIDHNKHIYKASSWGVRRVFARHKKAIAKYLEENPIDFKHEADLRKLLSFCSRLP
jgi:hypothetical protein